MGYLTYSVAPCELIGELEKFTSAVLFCSTDGIPNVDELLTLLRAHTTAPIFLISEAPEPGFTEVISPDHSMPDIINIISEYCKARELRRPGSYRKAGIDASVERTEVEFLSENIRFTKTERMILRILIRAYPEPLSAEDILKYAFIPGRAPEVAGIRTHLSMMNKKFKKETGRILSMTDEGRGYVLATPELLASKRDALFIFS